MVEHPVPDDKKPGDYHVGEQAGTQEGPDEDEFIVHDPIPQARAATVSAQVSSFVRIASFS
jgi:hypothetical protein